jgi:hypothetical protein
MGQGASPRGPRPAQPGQPQRGLRLGRARGSLRAKVAPESKLKPKDKNKKMKKEKGTAPRLRDGQTACRARFLHLDFPFFLFFFFCPDVFPGLRPRGSSWRTFSVSLSWARPSLVGQTMNNNEEQRIVGDGFAAIASCFAQFFSLNSSSPLLVAQGKGGRTARRCRRCPALSVSASLSGPSRTCAAVLRAGGAWSRRARAPTAAIRYRRAEQRKKKKKEWILLDVSFSVFFFVVVPEQLQPQLLHCCSPRGHRPRRHPRVRDLENKGPMILLNEKKGGEERKGNRKEEKEKELSPHQLTSKFPFFWVVLFCFCFFFCFFF